MVHVKSSDYEETEKIENITSGSNFAALIENETNEDDRLKHVEVKTAAFRTTRFHLGTFIHSTITRNLSTHLNNICHIKVS